MDNRRSFEGSAYIQPPVEGVSPIGRIPLSAYLATTRKIRRNSPVSRLVDVKNVWSVSHLPVLIGLFGGAMVAAGADAPLIHIPIVGSISYLHHPAYFTSYQIGEVVILIAAGLSIVCALLKRFKLLWLTGAVAIGQLAATLVIFQHTRATVVAQADRPNLVDPTLMWAGAALRHARFEWGIAVVAAGAAMLLAAAAWELALARRKKVQ
jgi:hypothetical protein